MKLNALFISILCFAGPLLAQESAEKPAEMKISIEQYIQKYSAVAVEEMFRGHIPASITLAQGLLESGNGNSVLATEANNHFGIKCKKSWTGASYYHDDDAPQECFRKYENAIDSYRDHTEFLLNNARYAFLFDLDPIDYKAWAQGLKKAGYATNPQYPELLISFIEKHNLQRFDKTNLSEEENKELKDQKAEVIKSYGTVFMINEVPAIVAKPGESYTQIAIDHDLKVWQIYKFNDLDKNAQCQAGDTVFIKNKRNKAMLDTYMVNDRESIHQIAQRMGIKMEKIIDRNRLIEGQEVAKGETLWFNSKRHDAIKLRDTVVLKEETIIIRVDSTPHPDTIIYNSQVYENPLKNMETMKPMDENTLSFFDSSEIPRQDLSFFHTVQKGETLYALAKKYNIRVDALQFLNNLSDVTLQVGQRLIINPNLPSADTKEPQTIPGIHVVRQGETLYSIARMYSTSPEEIKANNQLTTEQIGIGQHLIITRKK